MEEFFTQGQNLLIKYIDPIYLFVFLLTAYSVKKVTNKFLTWLINLKFNIVEFDRHLTIFIIGVIVVIPFWLFSESDKMKLFVTFTVGTSLHDILLRHLFALLAKIGVKKDEGN